MPTTGTASSSRSAASPLSKETASTTASRPSACSAASSTVIAAAIAFSVRQPMIGTPRLAVTATISVPGAAWRRATAAQASVTKALVLGLISRMRKVSCSHFRQCQSAPSS